CDSDHRCLKQRILLGVECPDAVSGAEAAFWPLVGRSELWAVLDAAGCAVIAGAEDALVADDQGSDGSSGASRAGFDQVRDLHEVRVPAWPLLHLGSDYGARRRLVTCPHADGGF